MEAINILKQKGVKVTQNRLELVNILEKANNPLNQKDIESRLKEQPDRVTLYRNLKFLVDHEMVHKIEVNGSVTSYSLNRVNLTDGHNSEHLHFHCSTCNKVICMPQCLIKEYDLPEGFTQQSSKLIVDGTCNLCNTKNKNNEK